MNAWTKGPIARKISWEESDGPTTSYHVAADQDDAVGRLQSADPQMQSGNVAVGATRPTPANDLLEGLKDRLIIDDTDPYFVASIEGRLLDCNDLYRKVAVSSAGALPLMPDDGGRGELPAAIMAVFEEVEALEKPMRYNERHVIGGTDHMFAARYVPVFDHSGATVAVVALYRDITEKAKQDAHLHEMRQKLNDYARSTSDWFWEVDRQFRLTSLSERFTSITGRLAQANIGRRLDELGDFQLNRMQEIPAYQSIKGRTHFRNQLVCLETDDGEKKTFSLSGVPIFDKISGNFMGYRGAGVDVTHSMDAEKDLSRAKSQLEQALKAQRHQNRELEAANEKAANALRAKEDFLANMSHELRTPLNAIIGFAQAMKSEVSGPLSPEYLGYAGNISDAGDDLLRLVEKLLSAGSLAGEATSAPDMIIESCELHAVLVAARGKAFAKRNISGMDLSGLVIKTDLVVQGNFDHLVDIFASILDNAARYTPVGSGFGVLVGLDEARKMAKVSIWDSGPGLNADEALNIFEPLCGTARHAHRASVNGDGAGLSLYLARQYLRQMGGEITVESEAGNGSQFHIYLPL